MLLTSLHPVGTERCAGAREPSNGFQVSASPVFLRPEGGSVTLAGCSVLCIDLAAAEFVILNLMGCVYVYRYMNVHVSRP